MENNKKTILIAEDETALLSFLTETLGKDGFRVIQAANGTVALESCMEKHPDLVLLDLVMPEMDGMTVMKKLRDDAWGKTVPIIILTNLEPDDKIVSGVVKNEPTYYIVKSDVHVDEIVEKVREVLKVA